MGADLYVEGSPSNIQALRDLGHRVLVMDNPTNRNIPDQPEGRGRDREEAEDMIRREYYEWLDKVGLERPPKPGVEPSWASTSPRPFL